MTAAPLLVFDLDGTLADTAPDLVDTLNVILAGEGVAPVAFAEARAMVGAGSRALIQRGLEASGQRVSPERLEALFAAFLVYYEAHIAEKSRLYPGVEAAFDRFAAAGFAFAVCTNKYEAPARLLLTQLGLAGRFACICGQDTFAAAKPDPRALLETIARAGGEAGRTIMVGDSGTDIQTAQNAGIPVIAVDFGYTERPIRDYRPDRVIAHYDDLWDAVAALSSRDRPSTLTSKDTVS